MTAEEIRQFIRSRARPGLLATVRADGRAHVAPVWIDLDEDGSIVFTTGAETVKGRNLRRTKRAAMCIDDDQPPFSFVTLEGPVTIDDDLAHVRELGCPARWQVHGRRPGRGVRGPQRRSRRTAGPAAPGTDVIGDGPGELMTYRHPSG